MEISMNIYVFNKLNKGFDIKEEVLNRFGENDCQDLYDAIFDIEDETEREKLEGFIDNASEEDLSKVITVDENSLEIDHAETLEWNCNNGVAYKVDITLDINKILKEVA